MTLPLGSMTDFNALKDFVRVSVKNLDTGKTLKARTRDVCLNSRASGSAPTRRPGRRTRSTASPTPTASAPCRASRPVGPTRSSATTRAGRAGVRLAKGTYDVTISIASAYAKALQDPGRRRHPHRPGRASSTTTRATTTATATATPRRTEPVGKPATQAPTGPELDEVDGPQPNLKSLPAWGISMANNGNFLRFAATVWNAGDSPLVVDGFRRDGEAMMDAYQYFFDGDGDQTGYQKIGEFEFDEKPSHQHWHFRDFASYTLLRADKTTAAVSKKEAFCLANTDSIDQTVTNADWNPENTDLSTDCGEPGSLSLRQVLAAGWGDTYAQFRAGQSFNLKDLPNGTYYIATIANPNKRLVESDTDGQRLPAEDLHLRQGRRPQGPRPQDRPDRRARAAVVIKRAAGREERAHCVSRPGEVNG